MTAGDEGTQTGQTKLERSEPGRQKVVRSKTDWLLLLLLAASAGLGINALVACIELDRFSDTYQQVRERQYDVLFLFGILQYGIITPLFEEIIFRRILYGLCAKRLSWKWAMLISAAVFGFYHGNMIQGIYGFLMGLLLGYVYHYFASFAAPVLFHGTANLLVFMFSYDPQFIPPRLLPVVAAAGIAAAVLILLQFWKRDAL